MATFTIAVAGKGGVGKTTTCGMMIDYLCKQKKGPILVVDADANSNLNEVLGVEVETTRMGPFFCLHRYSIIMPQVVVLPTPPLPATAMVNVDIITVSFK